MSNSTANLPIHLVLAACDRAFRKVDEYVEGEWHGRRRDLLEKFDSKEAWRRHLKETTLPVALHSLCMAAQESGETKVQVTASDFDLISLYYEAK